MSDSKSRVEIDYEFMKNFLHKSYYMKKHVVLSREIEKEETRTIWFRKADIQDFLEQVVKREDISGIRVYLCSYGPEVEIAPNGQSVPHNPDFVKQLTLGLVATKTEEEREVDYIEVKEEEKVISLTFLPPQNHGELCPTVCKD